MGTLDNPLHGHLAKNTRGVGGRIGFVETCERVRASMHWPIPSFVQLANTHRDCTFAICGGGPSVANDIDTIRRLRKQGAYIMTVNKTHDYLREHGIRPDFHVLLDPMDWVADYVKQPVDGCRYLIASQCHRDVYRKLRHGDCYLWHAYSDFYGVNYPSPILEREFTRKEWVCVPGPTTVGMRAIYCAQTMGGKFYHMLGMDSSMVYDEAAKAGRLHAYAKAKPEDAEEGWAKIKTQAGVKSFYTNSHMARQVDDFDQMLDQFAVLVKMKRIRAPHFTVYGQGLLPTYAATLGWHADPMMNAVYEWKHTAAQAGKVA